MTRKYESARNLGLVIPTPNGGGIWDASAADERNDRLMIRGSEPIYEMYSRM